MTATAFFIGFYEPLVIALYNPETVPHYSFLIEDCLTLAFTIDIVMHLISEPTITLDDKDYRDPSPEQHCCANRERMVESWMDLIIVLPGWVSIFDHDNTLFSANILLCFRLARLLQSSRSYRVMLVMSRMHARYGYPMFAIEVMKLFFLTAMSCHWLACLFLAAEGSITTGFFSYSTKGKTWMTELIMAKGDPCTPSMKEDRFCQYGLAYYWAVTTLTSVGYGDIVAQNKVEYVVVAMGMLVVGYTWALIVATIVSILSSLSVRTAEFRECLDGVEDMARRRNLEGDLRYRLRTFVHETKHLMTINYSRKLLETYCSEGLQRDVVIGSAEIGMMLDAITWMKDIASKDAILDIIRSLVPMAYSGGERVCMQQAMIVVQRGLLGHKGRIVKRGDILGAYDILLETQALVDASPVQTIGFVETLRLSKSSLVQVGRTYPEVDIRLRKAQIRTAVLRAIVYHARRAQQKKVKELKAAVALFRNPSHKASLVFQDLSGPSINDLTSLAIKAAERQRQLHSSIEELTDEIRGRRRGG